MSTKVQNVSTLTDLNQLKSAWKQYMSEYSELMEKASRLHQFIYFLHKIDKRSQTEIAKELGVTLQRINFIVKSMEKKGVRT